MHLIALHLILLQVPALPKYELSSNEDEADEPPLHSEDPADSGSALDDMKPQIGPPIPQMPPAQTSFDFAAFMCRSGGNTTTLLATIREADAYLPSGIWIHR